MSRRENNRLIAREYIKFFVFMGLMGAFLAWAFVTFTRVHPAADVALIMVISAGVAAPLTVWLIALARWRVERTFLQPDPEKVIRAMRSGRVANWSAAAWSAYTEAWVYTLYGRFNAARRALDRVHWASERSTVRAAATSVEALLCFLDTRDLGQGLALARDARAKADISSAFPGAKTELAFYDALILIGRVMGGTSNGKIIAKLADHAQTPPFGSRIIALWGLAVARARAGDRVSALDTLELCREMAPYCGPLLSLPAVEVK